MQATGWPRLSCWRRPAQPVPDVKRYSVDSLYPCDAVIGFTLRPHMAVVASVPDVQFSFAALAFNHARPVLAFVSLADWVDCHECRHHLLHVLLHLTLVFLRLFESRPFQMRAFTERFASAFAFGMMISDARPSQHAASLPKLFVASQFIIHDASFAGVGSVPPLRGINFVVDAPLLMLLDS